MPNLSKEQTRQIETCMNRMTPSDLFAMGCVALVKFTENENSRTPASIRILGAVQRFLDEAVEIDKRNKQ